MKYRVLNAYRGAQSIGKGLFAKQNISKGDFVIGMNPKKIQKFSEKKWDAYHVAHRMPHDGAIFVTRIEKRVTDWGARMPTWYRLNHSPNPNLEMKYERARIVWRATRDIWDGEELTFFYLEGTEDWI